MSSQVQPQQPVQIYPNSVSSQPSSDHSNGSFGTVFIVLAVIIVISAIACFLGRLCNRRYSHSHNQKPLKHQKQNHHNNFRPKQSDIEMGFDKRIACSKPKGLGNGHGYGYGRGRGGPKHPPNYGDMKGFEMKLGRDGELRAGA